MGYNYYVLLYGYDIMSYFMVIWYTIMSCFTVMILCHALQLWHYVIHHGYNITFVLRLRSHIYLILCLAKFGFIWISSAGKYKYTYNTIWKRAHAALCWKDNFTTTRSITHKHSIIMGFEYLHYVYAQTPLWQPTISPEHFSCERYMYL